LASDPLQPKLGDVNDHVPEPSSIGSRISRLLRRIRGPVLPIGDRMIDCAVCGASVVNPVDWHGSDATHWWVLLRCGACAWSREAIITDEEATRLERDLEPGLQAIADALDRLDRERMLRESECFITALRRDLIGPADFAPRLPR
jgi:hypothetical protein